MPLLKPILNPTEEEIDKFSSRIDDINRRKVYKKGSSEPVKFSDIHKNDVFRTSGSSKWYIALDEVYINLECIPSIKCELYKKEK